MSRESAALLKLAESIADGGAIDWDAAESEATADERAVMRQLRVLADVAILHRSLPANPDDWRAPAGTVARPNTPAIGNWGHLVLLERLGSGTAGEVYRAWDGQLEREVALKLLRAGTSADPQVDRITREGRLLARVRHPSVITVYGVGVHDGRAGLWMELVRGATLEQTVAARGAFSAREAALVGIDLCRALAAIHAAGLIHRDVKAQNVVREEGGRTVLMDLGTGRERSSVSTPGSDLTGTPLYLAPEVLQGAPASARSDIYSTGVLLYRLVTKAFPVRATSIEELHAAHANAQDGRLRDARPDLPTAFVSAVDRAIASDPARRQATAGALEADLVRALEAPVPRPRVWRRTAALAAMVLAVVALAALASPWLRSRFGTAAGPIRSIAVLPLVNLSGDPAQEYFAEGMTDELIAKLGQSTGLGVISRTSVMQFKGTARRLPEIASALGADAILEGSVLLVPAGGEAGQLRPRRVRINARLIAAGTDTQLWDRTFEVLVDDVLALQSQVARAVADGIQLRLSNHQMSALAGVRRTGQPQDFEAYDLYLRGRYFWNLRTPEDLNRSLEYFRKAIALDPQFAAAYAGLADAYLLSGIIGSMPYADSLRQARIAATTAIELDDTLAEAHVSLAGVQDRQLEWQAADASYRRALGLNAGYARAHHWYSALLVERGRFEEALMSIQRAQQLDPLSASVRTQAAAIRFLSRRYDDAIYEAQQALQIDANFVRAHLFIAEAYSLKGDHAKAFEAASRAAVLGGQTAEWQSFMGCFSAAAGKRAEAFEIADDLIQRYAKNKEGEVMGVAMVYACLRENDRAFEWLDRAQALREPWLAYLKVQPFFDSLHTDPRFDRLIATLGLTQ